VEWELVSVQSTLHEQCHAVPACMLVVHAAYRTVNFRGLRDISFT